jgi:phospholipase C
MAASMLAPAAMVVAAAIALVAAGGATAGAAASAQQRSAATPIKHFIFLMQGARTFDNYFGTYPGADGTPKKTCQLRQPKDGCVKPFPLHGKQQFPLNASKTIIVHQYDHGKMDGFVSAYEQQGRDGTSAMGYYDRQDLPFYWTVAHNYVLFDHFFSSALYGIRANRSYWVAAAPPPSGTGKTLQAGYARQLTIFDRLQAAGVSWKFYVQGYLPAAGTDTQAARVPLLNYARFSADPVLRTHIVGLDQYYLDLAAGKLPAVAFVASSAGDNERSAHTILGGQNLVRNMVTQLMESSSWDSSALLWSYDGSGGLYDHVKPPQTKSGILGFRVPSLLVSAYARQGQINHTVLDYTSALRFIEDNWGLAPLTSRDASANGLASAFDFTARPRPAQVLPPVSSAVGPLPHKPPPVPAKMIYGLYGGAAVASVIIVLFAAVLPLLSRKRRAAAAGRTAPTDAAGP